MKPQTNRKHNNMQINYYGKKIKTYKGYTEPLISHLPLKHLYRVMFFMISDYV